MTSSLWMLCGLVGSVLFFGRFYVQWLASEWRGRYVVPISFWYMSAGGALLLFLYAWARESPGGTFGLCFNMVIYARNIALLWKEEGKDSGPRLAALYGVTLTVTLWAALLTLQTWQHGYRPTSEFWVLSTIWAVGQGVFFARFGVQWVWAEMRGKSEIPAAFWRISLVGLVLHGAYFIHREDWLLAFGTIADGLPYARNLWLMKRSRDESA